MNASGRVMIFVKMTVRACVITALDALTLSINKRRLKRDDVSTVAKALRSLRRC